MSLRIDPTDLVRGLCFCLGVKFEDVTEVSFTPTEIRCVTLMRDEDGKVVRGQIASVWPWRPKQNA